MKILKLTLAAVFIAVGCEAGFTQSTPAHSISYDEDKGFGFTEFKTGLISESGILECINLARGFFGIRIEPLSRYCMDIPYYRTYRFPLALYTPYYKADDSDSDNKNIEKYIDIRPLTRGINLDPRLNQAIRNNSTENNSVLQRGYQDWPELKRYVEKNGFDHIKVIGRRRNKKPNSFNMENAIIEIALPGSQFNRNFIRTVSKRYNINLAEFQSIRSHRNSIQNDEMWGRD